MRTIRSLLWVGSGEGLARSGLTEAPELDITWVPDVVEAVELPAIVFDGLLLEWPDTPEPPCASRLEAILSRLERHAPRAATMLAIPEAIAGQMPHLATLEVGAVFVIARDLVGPGFVNEINQTLDELGWPAAALRPAPAPTAARASSDSSGSAEPVNAANETDAAAITLDVDADETPEEAPPLRRHEMIGQSDAMKGIDDLIGLAASSPSTVLITGETGVGKEVVARALHARSTREEEPFVGINCAAFPETLLESELFGHAKGAFTGANRAKPGLFEAAGHGTLFLDEIAETTMALQAKLLRILQEREVRAVGENHAKPIHCRIVAATNRTLTHEVDRGRFRQDLYYRLNVFPIRVPPLRERRSDILPLAQKLLERHAAREGKRDCHLSLAAGHLLEAYHWPGNVRELENEILRALMLSQSGALITPRELSPKLAEILEPIAEGAHPEESLREALDRIEAWLLRRALANNGGRKARTARRLGLTREGLYKKLKRLQIE